MDAPVFPSQRRVLVIGYGNPLRGDDGFGSRAADTLAAIPEIAADPSIQVETVHQLTPEVAETIAAAETVLFIDAALPDGEPGALRFEEVGGVSPAAEPLGHHLTPAQALAYAEAMYGARPGAWIASVNAGSFDYATTLTPAVEAAIPNLILWFHEHFGLSVFPTAAA